MCDPLVRQRDASGFVLTRCIDKINFVHFHVEGHLLVYAVTLAHLCHGDNSLRIIHGVDNPVVADSHTISLKGFRQRSDAGRARRQG